MKWRKEEKNERKKEKKKPSYFIREDKMKEGRGNEEKQRDDRWFESLSKKVKKQKGRSGKRMTKISGIVMKNPEIETQNRRGEKKKDPRREEKGSSL
jgi:hypothetical protein